MVQKKQISRKHVGKKITSGQDSIIAGIYKEKQMKSWLEAKHEYFENQAKYDKDIKWQEDITGADEDDMKAVAEDIKKRKDKTVGQVTQPFMKPAMEKAKKNMAKQITKEVKKITIGLKKKSRTLTISETKLGITMVLTKEDCLKIGFKGTEMTRDAIKTVRAKLGLPEKPMRG